MWWSHVLIAACLQLIGTNLAIDTYAQVPWKPTGQPWWDCENGGCTETMMGGPVEWAPGQCYLPLDMEDPYFDFLWCHPVTIADENGPVNTTTPCAGDPGLTTNAGAPYALREYWAEQACPPSLAQMGFCTVANVCTPADETAGFCTVPAGPAPPPLPIGQAPGHQSWRSPILRW